MVLKLAGQSPRTLVRGGKSGLPRAGCRLTAGGREAMESDTENQTAEVLRCSTGKGEKVR